MVMNILPASEVRGRFAALLRELQKAGRPCFITKNGRAVAALMPMVAYEQLMSDLEDRLDERDETLAAEIGQARREFRQGRYTVLKPRRR